MAIRESPQKKQIKIDSKCDQKNTHVEYVMYILWMCICIMLILIFIAIMNPIDDQNDILREQLKNATIENDILRAKLKNATIINNDITQNRINQGIADMLVGFLFGMFIWIYHYFVIKNKL